MKESPRRYTNPFLSDEENEKLNLWTQELEHPNIEHDKLTNSLGETELYTDKNVMECDFPELLICYKEGAFHVKDICVDEGIPHGERFLFDENNNEMLNPEQLRYSTMEDYYMESNVCSGTDAKSDTGLLVLEPSNDHINIGDNYDEVPEKKYDAFSESRAVDADLPLNGPINDHRNMGNLGIDTEIPAQDLPDPIPDYKECGHTKEVSDSVSPNELKEISKDDRNVGNGISNSYPDGFTVSLESVTVSKATDNDGPDISVQPDEKMIYSSDNLLDNVSTEEENLVSKREPSLEHDLSVTVSKVTSDDGQDISVQPDEKLIYSSDNLLDNVSTEKLISNSEPSLEQDISVTVSKATDNDGLDISVQPDEKTVYSSDNSSDTVSTEKLVSNSEPSLEQDRSVTVSKATENDGPDISVQHAEKLNHSSDNLLDNISTEKVALNSGPSLQQERLLPSLKSLLESIDQQPFQSPVEDVSKRPDENGKTLEGNNTLNLNNAKPANSSEHVHNMENLEHVAELPIESNGAPKLLEMDSDNVAMINQVHRGEGESSFSVAGPVPEHITYSGPIAFSGSTSLRSDSSTTSTRSFAFPILQNEWNSSPVRMAKADRRRLQKHRGWKHGLLCCRF